MFDVQAVDEEGEDLVVAGHLNGHPWGEGGDSLLSCLMCRHFMKKVRTLAVAGHLNGHLGGRGEVIVY